MSLAIAVIVMTRCSARSVDEQVKVLALGTAVYCAASAVSPWLRCSSSDSRRGWKWRRCLGEAMRVEKEIPVAQIRLGGFFTGLAGP